MKLNCGRPLKRNRYVTVSVLIVLLQHVWVLRIAHKSGGFPPVWKGADKSVL